MLSPKSVRLRKHKAEVVPQGFGLKPWSKSVGVLVWYSEFWSAAIGFVLALMVEILTRVYWSQNLD